MMEQSLAPAVRLASRAHAQIATRTTDPKHAPQARSRRQLKMAAHAVPPHKSRVHVGCACNFGGMRPLWSPLARVPLRSWSTVTPTACQYNKPAGALQNPLIAARNSPASPMQARRHKRHHSTAGGPSTRPARLPKSAQPRTDRSSPSHSCFATPSLSASRSCPQPHGLSAPTQSAPCPVIPSAPSRRRARQRQRLTPPPAIVCDAPPAARAMRTEAVPGARTLGCARAVAGYSLGKGRGTLGYGPEGNRAFRWGGAESGGPARRGRAQGAARPATAPPRASGPGKMPQSAPWIGGRGRQGAIALGA